jgi:vacuolar-type H+-ATPase subunit H
MTKDKNKKTPDAVEQAMNTVLQAERAAEQAIADCRQKAQRTVQAAQEQAQRIAARTDERLAQCQMRCSSRLAQELKERQRAEKAAGQDESTRLLDDTGLADVVAAVTRDLIGSAQPEDQDRDTSK